MKFSVSETFLSTIFLFILGGLILCPIISSTSDPPIDTSSQERLRIAQDTPEENIDLEIMSTSHLIWLNGKVVINLDSSISGLLDIILVDYEGGAFFQTYIAYEDVSSIDNNKKIEIPINLQIYTLPGKYNLYLRIYYLENLGSSSTKILESTLSINVGLGIPVFIVVMFIFFIGATFIISKKEKTEVQTTSTGAQQPSGLEAPQGKIKCPECKKTIDEGLTFCPECGIRIPEFLRFNPTTL